MRIADVVVDDLLGHPGLTMINRSVYLLAWSILPKSVSELARRAGASRGLVMKACRHLVAAKWMVLEKTPHGFRPIPVIPVSTQAKLAQRLEAGYAFAGNKGEYLMKRNLDMRISCDYYVDNARPGFLEHPLSNYSLEYDRYYPQQGVAFEFNGPQHYRTTSAFANEESQKEFRERDLVKAALSRENGVMLITVTAEDLRPGRFEQLIPHELPRRHVDKDGPHFRALARLSEAYAAKAARSHRPRDTAKSRA